MCIGGDDNGGGGGSGGSLDVNDPNFKGYPDGYKQPPRKGGRNTEFDNIGGPEDPLDPPDDGGGGGGDNLGPNPPAVGGGGNGAGGGLLLRARRVGTSKSGGVINTAARYR